MWVQIKSAQHWLLGAPGPSKAWVSLSHASTQTIILNHGRHKIRGFSQEENMEKENVILPYFFYIIINIRGD